MKYSEAVAIIQKDAEIRMFGVENSYELKEIKERYLTNLGLLAERSQPPAEYGPNHLGDIEVNDAQVGAIIAQKR